MRPFWISLTALFIFYFVSDFPPMGLNTSFIPGWHTTVLPIYDIRSLILCLAAILMIVVIALRTIFRLERFITINLIDVLNQIILAAGIFVGASLLKEVVVNFLGGYTQEYFAFINRIFGAYWWLYFLLILLNVVVPQLLWRKNIRQSPKWSLVVALLLLGGFWLENLILVKFVLNRDFMPS